MEKQTDEQTSCGSRVHVSEPVQLSQHSAAPCSPSMTVKKLTQKHNEPKEFKAWPKSKNHGEPENGRPNVQEKESFGFEC